METKKATIYWYEPAAPEEAVEQESEEKSEEVSDSD